MSALSEVLKQYGAGELDDATALASVIALLKGGTGKQRPGSDQSRNVLERYGDSLLADDNDPDGTWQEVSIAYTCDWINADQYKYLAEGYVASRGGTPNLAAGSAPLVDDAEGGTK